MIGIHCIFGLHKWHKVSWVKYHDGWKNSVKTTGFDSYCIRCNVSKYKYTIEDSIR